MDTDRDEVVWRCIKAGSSKFSFYLFCKVLGQNQAHTTPTPTPRPHYDCVCVCGLGRVTVVSRACHSLVAGNTRRSCICRIRFAPLAQHNCFLSSCPAQSSQVSRADELRVFSRPDSVFSSWPSSSSSSSSGCCLSPAGQRRHVIMTTWDSAAICEGDSQLLIDWTAAVLVAVAAAAPAPAD